MKFWGLFLQNTALGIRIFFICPGQSYIKLYIIKLLCLHVGSAYVLFVWLKLVRDRSVYNSRGMNNPDDLKGVKIS